MMKWLSNVVRLSPLLTPSNQGNKPLLLQKDLTMNSISSPYLSETVKRRFNANYFSSTFKFIFIDLILSFTFIHHPFLLPFFDHLLI